MLTVDSYLDSKRVVIMMRDGQRTKDEEAG